MVTVSTTTRTAQDLTAQARDVLGVSRLTNHALTSWLHGLPGVDQVGCEARAAALGTRSIKTTSKAWAIDTAIAMIDLTTLEGCRHPRQGAFAVRQGPACPTRPTRRRRGPRRSASTATWSPPRRRPSADSGDPRRRRRDRVPQRAARRMAVKLADTRDAVEAGADEIDMVIDRGAFLSGRLPRRSSTRSPR